MINVAEKLNAEIMVKDFTDDNNENTAQAINSVTSYTVSESVEVGGTVGFEAGVSGSDVEAKGSGSFSAGANFSSSYTFEVQDCTCKGNSLSENNASAEWEYKFKRASQNRAAGKWQRLHDPAALA